MFSWIIKRQGRDHTPLSEQELMHIEFGAEATIELFEEELGVTLDFSPESLSLIDKYLLDFHAEGVQPEELKLLIYSLGCYVGETMVKNLNGRWVHPSAGFAKRVSSNEAVLLPSGIIWNPIAKTKKLLVNGSEDSVLAMYSMAAC